MSKPTLYKIYYGDVLAYVGRTKQKLQDRVRGHMLKKPMHREIDIFNVTRIDYTEFKTVADMYVYEIYLINLLKPPLNRDDKANDELTLRLPEREWKEFETPLWEKWKERCAEIAENERLKIERRTVARLREQELRQKRRRGEITEEDYWQKVESLTGEGSGEI
jgi:hypothetical protein